MSDQKPSRPLIKVPSQKPQTLQDLSKYVNEIQELKGKLDEALGSVSILRKEKENLIDLGVSASRQIENLQVTNSNLSEGSVISVLESKFESEIAYLRGIVENFSKGGRGHAGKD